MIPEAAVEAALKEWGVRGDVPRNIVNMILEAAAPHMLAEAWDKGLDWAWNGGPDMHDDNPYRTAK